MQFFMPFKVQNVRFVPLRKRDSSLMIRVHRTIWLLSLNKNWGGIKKVFALQ